MARRGSGGGTGAAFDEREDVLFLDLRAESRMRHVIEMFRDDLDRAGHPSEMLLDFQKPGGGERQGIGFRRRAGIRC